MPFGLRFILGFVGHFNLGGSSDGSVGVSGCGIVRVQLAVRRGDHLRGWENTNSAETHATWAEASVSGSKPLGVDHRLTWAASYCRQVYFTYFLSKNKSGLRMNEVLLAAVIPLSDHLKLIKKRRKYQPNWKREIRMMADTSQRNNKENLFLLCLET